jgi:peptidoglycan-associated lipoprotein
MLAWQASMRSDMQNKAKRASALFSAFLGAGLWGACAHKPAIQEAAQPAPVLEQTASSVPSDSASDRAQRERQDLASLLQGTVIHFDYDAYLLTPDGQARLQNLAEALREHRTVQIKIAGNCDSRGTDEYNLVLGQQRAGAAKKYLVNLGIDPKRIEIISYGKERPVDPRDTEEAWAANRRDEFSAIAGL